MTATMWQAVEPSFPLNEEKVRVEKAEKSRSCPATIRSPEGRRVPVAHNKALTEPVGETLVPLAQVLFASGKR